MLHKNDFQADRIWGGLQIFGLWTHLGRVYFRFSARAARRKFGGGVVGFIYHMHDDAPAEEDALAAWEGASFVEPDGDQDWLE